MGVWGIQAGKGASEGRLMNQVVGSGHRRWWWAGLRRPKCLIQADGAGRSAAYGARGNGSVLAANRNFPENVPQTKPNGKAKKQEKERKSENEIK